MSNTSALVTLSCFQALASVQGRCGPGHGDGAFPLAGSHPLPVPSCGLEVLPRAGPGSLGGVAPGTAIQTGLGARGPSEPHVLVLLQPWPRPKAHGISESPQLASSPGPHRGLGVVGGWLSPGVDRAALLWAPQNSSGPGIGWHLQAPTQRSFPAAAACDGDRSPHRCLTSSPCLLLSPTLSRPEPLTEEERWLWVTAPSPGWPLRCPRTQKPGGPDSPTPIHHFASPSPNPLPPWNRW